SSRRRGSRYFPASPSLSPFSHSTFWAMGCAMRSIHPAVRHDPDHDARRRCLGRGPLVSPQGGESLLIGRDLVVDLRRRHGVVHAVRGLSYSLDKGEAMGIAGESGSGKTISSLALLGLLPAGTSRVVRGSILFAGHDIVGMTDAELRSLRGARIAMVFQ